MEHGERNYNILLTTSYENEKEIKETLSLDTINRYSKVRYYQGIKDVKYSKDYLNYNDAVWEQTLKNNIYPVISLGEKEYQSYLNKLHLSYFDSKDKVILINNIIQTVYKNNKNIIKKENEFMLLFILGLFLGANLSLFLYACILAGKKSDE